MNKKIVILLLLILPVMFATSCSESEPKTKVVYVEKPSPQPATPSPTVKDPEPNVDPGTKSIEQHRYEEATEHAERAKESHVRESQSGDLTGREITTMILHGGPFENADTLEHVRYAIVQACQANNYTFTDEKVPSNKEFKFRIKSEMGPISLTETITNAVNEYDVKVRRDSPKKLTIEENTDY